MNYRKQKKQLTKLLNIAESVLDSHPLSSSANAQVRYIKHKLLTLKRFKHENL